MQVPPPHRALVSAHSSYGYQIDGTSGVVVTEALAIDSGTLYSDGRPASSATPSLGSSSKPRPGGPKSPAFPLPELIPRAAWGADESKRFTPDGQESSPIEFSPAQAITVHHTATALDDPDPAATVRAIYQQHTVANDWGDIGYNFLIDREGKIYEGRYSGNDGIPAHNSQHEVVTGFHTFAFNPGNLGIALLGDFSKGKQTLQMQDSLVRLTSALASLHQLDPLSSVEYRSLTTGKKTPGPALAGHRDWTSTECPGTNTYLDLGPIREHAAQLIR